MHLSIFFEKDLSFSFANVIVANWAKWRKTRQCIQIETNRFKGGQTGPNVVKWAKEDQKRPKRVKWGQMRSNGAKWGKTEPNRDNLGQFGSKGAKQAQVGQNMPK